MGLEDTNNLRDWDKRLKEQYSRGWDNYIRRRIYLDVARDLDCWGICGEFFYVESLSSAAAVGSIRLNRNTNDPIDLDLGTIVKTIFCNIFITHAALQGEWIDVIYGINFEYYKQQPVTVGAPVGGALAALQLPDGHNVTVDNAGGAAAVNIQDGGNSVTIDDGGGSITVDGALAGNVTVINAGGAAAVNIQDGGNAITVDAAALPLPAGAATSALQLPDGHNVTVDNAGGAAAVNIQDGGNAITVDAAALPLPAGAATSALQLPDGHNVTVDNGGGGAAVNIQDGGNTITVDAAALPLPVGAATSALQLPDGHNVTVDNAGGAAAVNIQDGGNAITVDLAAAQTLANVTTLGTITNVVHVDDNAGSLTIDGSVTAVDNGTAQPCITITNANADQNTVGANHACKRVLIRAHTINTGLVWVDFNNAAVALACYPLAAGDSVGVPLTNTNLVNCLFKVANEKVTVVYTN